MVLGRWDCVAFRSCLSRDNVLGMMGIVRMLVAVFGVLTITPYLIIDTIERDAFGQFFYFCA